MTNVIRQLRQLAGVDNVKVADFKRGVFAVTAKRGVELSESALLAAARRSGFQPDRVVMPADAAGTGTTGRTPSASQEPINALAGARAAFRQARYDDAIKRAREVAEKPQPSRETGEARTKAEALAADVQQLLSLAYFASGKYEDAASSARAALRYATPWTWKTLRAHYNNTADYTAQLRALENSVRRKSTPAKRLLVGYHYWMLGQTKAARAQFQRVAKANPDDTLVARLIRDLEKAQKQ